MGYTHGTKWTDELVISELKKIINSLGLDRFPTHSEMEDFFGNKSLACHLSKSGGTKFWANKLGLGVKDCESEMGNYYEIFALKDIYANVNMTGYLNKPRYPYDLTIEKHIKVDVKSAQITTNNNGYLYYSFNLEKKEPTCDIFIFYCIDQDFEICKTIIIPSCKLYGQTQLGISANGLSKWHKYENKWEYFNMYNDFYEKIRSIT